MNEDSGLEWTIHLARRRPRQTALAVFAILAASLSAASGFRSPFMGFLAAAILIASISDFLFPLTFTLSDEIAEARGPIHRRRMTWKQVRRVIRDELGVKLSPFLRPSRLDALRGIYVWFDDNAEDVMAFIADHVTEAARGDDCSPV